MGKRVIPDLNAFIFIGIFITSNIKEFSTICFNVLVITCTFIEQAIKTVDSD
jgi:hypothetical protein